MRRFLLAWLASWPRTGAAAAQPPPPPPPAGRRRPIQMPRPAYVGKPVEQVHGSSSTDS